MKNKVTLILIFSFFEICKAQTVDFYGKKINVTNVCSSLGFSDDNEAKNYLNQVCGAAGIRSNFIMVQCNSIGTCLAIEKDGDPYILYDNNFLNKLKSNISYGFSEKKINTKSDDGKDWTSMTILAHEIGHHENHHFSKTIRSANSIRDLELQADEYAGQPDNIDIANSYGNAGIQLSPDKGRIEDHLESNYLKSIIFLKNNVSSNFKY
jgi:hypothetical protein